MHQIVTRPKTNYQKLFLLLLPNFDSVWFKIDTCLAIILQFIALLPPLLLRSPNNYDHLLQVSLLMVSATLKLPQDIKHTDSWANGRLITTYLT